jgi:hypothetical protein
LKAIEENNKTLKALKETARHRSWKTTGIYLSNPEVGFNTLGEIG